MSHPFHPLSPDVASEAALPVPWLLTIRHRDMKPGGYFRPEAWVCFKAELRTSGFWKLLPAQEFKDWLLLLSFITPNGDCGASVEQLAAAMGVAKREARRRMERLEAIRWQARSLLYARQHEGGRVTYHPAAGLLRIEEETNVASSGQTPIQVPAGGSRAAVIEHSRQTYARPRREVEREIARLNDWPEPLEDVAEKSDAAPESAVAVKTTAADEISEETEQAARRQLLRLGVDKEQVEDLIRRHDLLRIRQQLTWLSYREVRSRSGFIVAAIEGNYDPPPAVKRRLVGTEYKSIASPELGN